MFIDSYVYTHFYAFWASYQKGRRYAELRRRAHRALRTARLFAKPFAKSFAKPKEHAADRQHFIIHHPGVITLVSPPVDKI